MKKILCLLLAILLFLPITVFAEQVAELKATMSTLSYDELLELNQWISEFLFQKEALVNGVKVPPGEYTIGTDIPAGTYRIEYRPRDDYSFCSIIAINEEPFLSFFTQLGFTSSNEIGKLELPEGAQFSLTGGDVYFYTYTGLFH